MIILLNIKVGNPVDSRKMLYQAEKLYVLYCLGLTEVDKLLKPEFR